MANYLDGILGHAICRPDAPALSLPDRTLTFGDLGQRLAGIAAGLALQEIPAGAIVAVAARRQDTTLLATLGIMLGGRIALPLDPQALPSDRQALIRRCGAVAVLADDARPGAYACPVFRPEDLPSVGDISHERHPGGGHPAQILVSSGTTGPAKLAAVSHCDLIERSLAIGLVVGALPSDRHLPVMNLAYALARLSAIRTLEAGGTVLLRPLPSGVPALLDLLRTERATGLTMTPSHLRTILDHMGDQPAPALPDVRWLSVSGALLPLADRIAVRRRLTPALHVVYGTNEAGLIAHAGPRELDLAPEGVGRPLPGVRVEILDDAGHPVPPGSVGEIRVASAQMSARYVGADPFAGHRDGWFHPGDTGWLDRQGLLHLAGRTDDRINHGGLKVYPFEVEAVLRTHPAVAECAVFGVPSRERQEEVAAAVVLSGDATPAALRAHCRAMLPPHKVPQRMLKLERLPRNETGKVLVRRLRERLSRSAD